MERKEVKSRYSICIQGLSRAILALGDIGGSLIMERDYTVIIWPKLIARET